MIYFVFLIKVDFIKTLATRLFYNNGQQHRSETKIMKKLPVKFKLTSYSTDEIYITASVTANF